jgi:hypothetical protein
MDLNNNYDIFDHVVNEHLKINTLQFFENNVYNFMRNKKQNVNISFCSKYNVRTNFIKIVNQQYNHITKFGDFFKNNDLYEIVFHGTTCESAQNICNLNFDITKRIRQAHGIGEYFSTSIDTAYTYSRGAIVCVLILKDNERITKINDIRILNNDQFLYCCPIGIIYHSDHIISRINPNINENKNIENNKNEDNECCLSHNKLNKCCDNSSGTNKDCCIDPDTTTKKNCFQDCFSDRFSECCSSWCHECFINCCGEDICSWILCIRQNNKNKSRFCYCRGYYDIFGHATSTLFFVPIYMTCGVGGIILIEGGGNYCCLGVMSMILMTCFSSIQGYMSAYVSHDNT